MVTEQGEAVRTGRVLAHYMAIAVSARLADEGARVALVLLALERADSAALGGALVGALLVPHVLAAPLVGALADRVRHRKLLYAACLGGVGAALLCCAVLTGRVPDAVVLVIAVAGGCCGPMVTGGLTGLLRELVPERQRTRAYSLDSMSYSLGQVGGPAVTAVLVAIAGAATATASLGLLAVAAGLLALGLPITARIDRAETTLGRAVVRLTAQGVGVLWHRPSLRAVTLSTTLGETGIGALTIAAALLAERYGTLSAGGGLIAVFAVGALLGSLLYARYPIADALPELRVVIALVAVGLPLLAIPLTTGLTGGLVVFFVAGLPYGPLLIAILTNRERQTPAEAHIQVFALAAGLRITGAAIGAAVAGWCSPLGPEWVIAGVAACQICGALLATALLGGPRGLTTRH